MANNIWDVINDISIKKPIWDKSIKKHYSQFMINRFFSCFEDIIEIIEEISQHEITDEQHYNFLCDTIPRSMYRSKFKMKPDEDKDTEILSKYYNINCKYAEEYLQLVDNSFVKEIKKQIKLKEGYGYE